VSEPTARIDLPAIPQTPYWARCHARATLGAWQITAEITETISLIISELVTNAVAAAAARSGHVPALPAPITQILRRQPDRLVIEISDPDPNPPVITDAGPDDESGRGLILVQALAKEWGHYFPPAGGKTVYAILSTST
jgi:anti-sigma regulatory factor (Ser/Thr protein kinase)